MAAKTEAATPRRLKRAREAGDIPLSGILVQAVVLLTGIAVSPLLLDRTRARLPELLRQAYRAPEGVAFLRQTAFELVWLILPWLGMVAAMAAVATLAQTGAAIRFPASFNTSLGNRVRGGWRLFDGPRLIAALLGALCASVIGCVAIALLCQYPRSLANSALHLRALGPLLDFFLRRLLWWALGLGLLAGLIDLLVVHRFWRERLKMTRAELREEQREAGNDPERRALQAKWRHDLLLSSPLQTVINSTLVIHDENRVAVLLSYDPDVDQAPIVTAIAHDDLAQRVIAEANDRGVPLSAEPRLTRSLSQVSPGSFIPESSYDEVARLLRPRLG